MPYTLIYAPGALKDLTTLSPAVQKRIIAKLEQLYENPFPHIKRLKGVPLYSLRIGDYRVILDVQEVRFIICVITAGHRKNVYNRLL